MSAIVVPPAGWTGGASQALVEQTGREGHFGGVHGVIEGERYDGPNLVLYATRINVVTSSPGDAAAAELTMVHHPVTTTAIVDGMRVVETAWTEGDVHGAGRLVLVATRDHIVAINGECYANGDAKPDAVAACSAALRSLDPAIAVKDRIDIPPPSSVPAVPQLTTAGPSATHVAMPPMTVKQEVQTDRRPVYVGAGLIVIAAIFWWNRRRAAHVR